MKIFKKIELFIEDNLHLNEKKTYNSQLSGISMGEADNANRVELEMIDLDDDAKQMEKIK